MSTLSLQEAAHLVAQASADKLAAAPSGTAALDRFVLACLAMRSPSSPGTETFSDVRFVAETSRRGGFAIPELSEATVRTAVARLQRAGMVSGSVSARLDVTPAGLATLEQAASVL